MAQETDGVGKPKAADQLSLPLEFNPAVVEDRRLLPRPNTDAGDSQQIQAGSPPQPQKPKPYDIAYNAGLRIGLTDRQADTLAKIAKRRRLAKRVDQLATPGSEYADAIERSQAMWEDQVEFYQKNKTLRIPGNSTFVRYGTLSLAYSQASPIRVIMWLIGDARAVQGIAANYREIYHEPPDGREYLDFSFDDERSLELAVAFRQDMRANSVDCLDDLLKGLEWENCYYANWRDEQSTKPSRNDIMDSLYIFFSSQRGRDYLVEWKADEAARPKLVKDFVQVFFNDPTINPALIDMHLNDVGTAKFLELCKEFPDSARFTSDGRQVRRGDIVATQYLQ